MVSVLRFDIVNLSLIQNFFGPVRPFCPKMEVLVIYEWNISSRFEVSLSFFLD